jgi:hypothetical protein
LSVTQSRFWPKAVDTVLPGDGQDGIYALRAESKACEANFAFRKRLRPPVILPPPGLNPSISRLGTFQSITTGGFLSGHHDPPYKK